MVISRRSWMGLGGAGLLSTLLHQRSVRSAARGSFDPAFGSAVDALRALRTREISSSELVDHVFRRIHQHNPQINAFLTLNEEEARKAAKRDDEELAGADDLGALHGLPILVKDTFETKSLKTTSGSMSLADHTPEVDAVAVARLRRAGAIIVGKTNMPEFASDLQSYNGITGTARNPWNPDRTPGGSTGGGAAALAAGFGFLEIGSDIGGSIRTPSHFCGVYGLKPTIHVVPLRGHIPPLPGEPQIEDLLGVAGPLARSPQDLLLELLVIGGPEPGMDRGYRWTLQPARGTHLKDYRIGFVLDDPFCPVSAGVRLVLEALIRELEGQGAHLTRGWPAGYDPAESFGIYLRLLGGAFSTALTEEERDLIRNAAGQPWEWYARHWGGGADGTHQAWRNDTGRQLAIRSLWQDYFREFDAFLTPANFLTAFAHDHEKSFFERTVSIPEGTRQYGDMLAWITPATLTGCPAVVAPAGVAADGLPVGIQIMGPFLEDAVPVHLAGILQELTGGFVAPPRFRTSA
jgi:amidase